MAAVTAAVVVAAGSAYAANRQGAAAKDQGRAARDAANQGIAAQEAERDRFNTNIAPYLASGQTGLTGLQGLLNDPNSIQDSNAYKWRFDQGLQANDRSAAARGSLFSGGHSADLLAYGQGMASQEYGDQWSRLMGLANMGQNSVMGAGQLGQNSANSISNLMGNRGQAIGQINSAGAMTQAGYGNALAAGAGAYAGAGGSFGKSAPQRTSSYGAFAPTSTGFGSSGGSLGPSNGQWWNFGQGGN